jgi:molybdenum cofactor cytidylyltransferase
LFVTGLVLAAGGSARLGQPKQLLRYRGRTILDGTLDAARRCGFDQLIVALGGAAPQIRVQVDLRGAQIVENPEFGTGCGSSIRTALPAVDPRAAGLVLLLGDQPEVAPGAVADLVRAAGGAPIGVCRYADALGHPFWLGRQVFAELGTLHGDKAVWRLAHGGRYDLVEVPVAGPVPVDVDTWDDYRRLRAGAAR